MLEKFFEVLKDLLPTKDLPTGVWVIRLFSISCISIIFVFLLNSLIQGTILGDRIGINQPKPTLPVLSHTEIIYSTRETWGELSKLRDFAPTEVRSAFLVFIVRKKDGNVISLANNNDKRTFPLIWVWNTVSNKNNISLRIIEDSFAPDLEKYRQIFNEKKKTESRYCFYSSLKNTTALSVIQRGIPGFDATHVIACGVYSKDDITIGATIAYVKLNPNILNDDESVTSVLYSLQDRLRTATDTIESKFNDLSIPYKFLYNSKP